MPSAKSKMPKLPICGFSPVRWDQKVFRPTEAAAELYGEPSQRSLGGLSGLYILFEVWCAMKCENDAVDEGKCTKNSCLECRSVY
jgi:hypothetical protein